MPQFVVSQNYVWGQPARPVDEDAKERASLRAVLVDRNRKTTVAQKESRESDMSMVVEWNTLSPSDQKIQLARVCAYAGVPTLLEVGDSIETLRQPDFDEERWRPDLRHTLDNWEDHRVLPIATHEFVPCNVLFGRISRVVVKFITTKTAADINNERCFTTNANASQHETSQHIPCIMVEVKQLPDKWVYC